MFKGGLTVADINRLRGSKNKEKEGKDNNEKERPEKESHRDYGPAEDFADIPRGSRLAELVASQIKEELLGMEAWFLAGCETQVETVVGRLGIDRKISELHRAVSSLKGIEGRVNDNISGAVKAMQDNVTEAIINFLRNPIATEPPHVSTPSSSRSAESQPDDNDHISTHNSGGEGSGEGAAPQIKSAHFKFANLHCLC